MELCVNMLLETVDATTDRKIERVLWIAPEKTSVVVLIQLNDRNALPRFCANVELDERFKVSQLRCLKSDPCADLSCDEETIAESYRKRRDKA
jgi:hypothetical protein